MLGTKVLFVSIIGLLSFDLLCFNTLSCESTTSLSDQRFNIFDLFDMYKIAGESKYTIGESITQTQHGEQSARLAQLSEFGHDHSLIAAALFHDVGHLLGMLNSSNSLYNHFQPKQMPGGLGTENHENLGSGMYFHFLLCSLLFFV